jgi:hypothetical protein
LAGDLQWWKAMSRFLAIATVALFWAFPLSAQTEDDSPNANSRYLIETVQYPNHVRGELRQQLEQLVGEKYDESLLERLADRIRKYLRVQSVTYRLVRGNAPGQVRVVFETRGHIIQQDAEITKAGYNSVTGFTGGVEASLDVSDFRLGAGLQSDGDTLMERFSGFNVYASHMAGSRIRFRVDFADYRDDWNPATVAADPEGAYTARRSVRPSISVLLARGVTYTAATDFEFMDFNFPAVRTGSANSVLQSLRLRRDWETSGTLRGEVDAGYNLRAATNLLDSDFVYVKNSGEARVTLVDANQRMTLKAGGGVINGSAPLFEQFVAGNTQVLRGWNKYELAPAGSTRQVYGSVEYRYSHFLVFYDTGAVWNRDDPKVLRHSVGAGVGANSWFLAVAFPIRGGGVEPVFMVATNF